MATRQEFVTAFKDDVSNIKVSSQSGKEYWVHRDQLPAILYADKALIYGTPLKPHPRAKSKVTWMNHKNLAIVEGETS